MSAHPGITAAVARTFDRAEAPSAARDAHSTNAASGATPFAALLHAAIATRTAVRPLTQPTAAEQTVDGAAEEQITATIEEDSSMVGAAAVMDASAQAEANPGGDVADGGVHATPHVAAGTVHRGLDGLVPELRERLERVLDRMRNEYGHDVRVSETYRTQERQDALHAQGRSAPGPVVTWTRRSNHTLGRAADIVVNDGYDDVRAYATLQRVAREEGLDTLGMRDPGHVELPKDVGGALAGGRAGRGGMVELAEVSRITSDARVQVTEVSVQRRAAPAPVAAVAQVAAVAPMARVANVARVAWVASVATPGAASRAASSMSSATGATTSVPVSAAGGRGAQPASASARDGARSDAHDRGGEERGAGEHGGAATEATSGERIGAAHLGGAEHARGATPGARAESVHGMAGADALARMDAIAALRDGAAARPLSHLTLTVDDGAGGADRIRVDARGGTVGVTLDMSDAAAAGRAGARLGELQQALEQRGLETDTLRVRGGGSNPHTGQQHAQQQERQDHHAPRERDGRSSYDDRAYDDQRRDPSSRQRSRQEHMETDK